MPPQSPPDNLPGAHCCRLEPKLHLYNYSQQFFDFTLHGLHGHFASLRKCKVSLDKSFFCLASLILAC